jgi:tetratricopeptide (TPR) repeat protein
MSSGFRPQNAIDRRLDRLSAFWEEFTEDPDARLLRWLVTSDEMQIVRGFVEQQRSGAGNLPDLFLLIEAPFDEDRRYGITLRQELIKLYDDLKADDNLRQDLLAENVSLGWVCPGLTHGASDMAAFLEACASFCEYYESAMVHLALAVLPERISHPSAWRDWWIALLRHDVPHRLRFTVLDSVEAPVLDGLAAAEPTLVRTVTPKLDMAGAVEELVREAGGTGPGVMFRKHFIALTNAAAKRNLAEAEQAASAALQIAVAQKWLDQQVVIHIALGAAYFSAGKSAEAIARYREAGRSAADMVSQQNPVGPTLLVQSRLSEAAVLVGEKQYHAATQVYKEAAALASQEKSFLLALEGWRMSGYCHEMAGDIDAAWRSGCQALEIGELLDDKVRPDSTLPYVGQGLLRLTRHSSYSNRAPEVRQRLTELVGADWETKIDEGESSVP